MTATNTTLAANRAYLIALRKALDLTQAEMAAGLGLALRSYHALENGESACRPIHIMAAERLTLAQAAQKRDPKLLAIPVQGDIRDLMDQWHLVVA